MASNFKKRKTNQKPVEINVDDLKLVEKVGEGGFGEVFHMLWKRKTESDLAVAAKRLFTVDDRELEVLSILDHPNIVKLIGVVKEEINFMLILELCKGGSLRTFLTNHKHGPLSSELRRSWAIQAARAIEYLQEEGFIHKDVKSENYLIATGNILKLADFGLAKLADRTFSEATGSCSTAYMAPELFREGRLSPTYDIFAYGVVLWELETREVPFEGKQKQVILYLVCLEKERLPIPEDCPEDLANLMRQCWQEDRNKRPRIQEVLEVLTKGTRTTSSKTQICKELGTWILQAQRIGKLNIGAAQGIAICPTGDIAFTDFGAARLKVYSCIEGKLKHQVRFSNEQQTTSPYAVAVSSDGTYFVTDQTKYVKVMDASCSYNKEQFPFELQDAGSPNGTTDVVLTLAGLSIDNGGNLLVGCPVDKKGYIGTYTPDGLHLTTIKVNIRPQYLAVTPTGKIIVSSRDPETVQVVDTSGQTLHTVKAPQCVIHWWPRGVCCSKDAIFVSNAAPGCDSGIYCYAACGEYTYLGCIISEVTIPMGLAVTPDGKTLMVAERDEGVKIFKRMDLENNEAEGFTAEGDSDNPESGDSENSESVGDSEHSESAGDSEHPESKESDNSEYRTTKPNDLETPELEDPDTFEFDDVKSCGSEYPETPESSDSTDYFKYF